MSVLLHTMLAFAASLSLTHTGSGRGGGLLGSRDGDPAASGRGFEAMLWEPGERFSTARVPQEGEVRVLPSDDPWDGDTVKVIPPTFDIYEIPTETTGRTTARAQPLSEALSRRPTGAFERLPGSDSGHRNEPQEGASAGEAQTRVSRGTEVSGSGGNAEGAGSGTDTSVYSPAPEYPMSARRKRIEGAVVVEFVIDPEGSVVDVSVAEGSGCEALDRAALSAAREWRFRPAASASSPSRSERVRFVFKLSP